MVILVIATLDTKGKEAAFIKERIQKAGHTVLLIDPGTLGIPGISADITRQEIASASGLSLEQILAEEDKGFTQEHMIKGLINIVQDLFDQDKFDGVIAVGGGQGTALATSAMKILPVGVPKVMVSTVACGKTTFGPYVGTKDVTMIHSVADINGLNFVTRKIIAQAVSAVIAMAGTQIEDEHTGEKPLIAITAAGVTTPGVTAVKSSLEEKGYEVIVFHCNGIGGQAMEELIHQGVIKGVIDYSPHEIIDLLYDGLMPALPGRMTAAGEMGIPQIVLPGCADMLLYEWRDDFPQALLERKHVRHTPTHTHFRTTYSEMKAVAGYVTEHLNPGSGPRVVVVPLGGYSMLNKEGKSMWDPHANQGFLDGVRASLDPAIQLIEDPGHINDPDFAERIVQLFISMYQQHQKEQQ